MGCGNKKPTDSLVQINAPARRSSAPKSVAQANAKQQTDFTADSEPKLSPVHDFHCGVCTLTLHNRPKHYAHRCRGEQPASYKDERTRGCDGCQHNVDGICVEYKRLYPERDAVIYTGIRMPYAGCPLGIWPKTLVPCPKCEAMNFNEKGPSICRYCGHSMKPGPKVEAGWVSTTATSEDYTPQQSIAVCTVCVGDEAEQLGQYTLPAMQRYADKCQADLVVIRGDGMPGYPLANKFRVQSVAAAYKRTLFVDVDAYIREDTPDLFQALSPGFVYAHEDIEFLSEESRKYFRSEFRELAKSQRIHLQPTSVINSGVVLLDQEHAAIWQPPGKPFRQSHTAEQSWVECNLRSGSVPFRPLETQYNTQWWFADFAAREPDARIVHLANCPHEQRLELLQRYAGK